MPLTKECRREVEEVLRQLIAEYDPAVTADRLVITRIWREGGLLLTLYRSKDEPFEDDFDRLVGFHLISVMTEKKARFGSSVLSWV